MLQISKLLAMTVFTAGAVASAQNSAIIFEETTVVSSKKITILEGGQSVRLGDTEIIRPHVHMRKGSVRIGSQVITSDGRQGIITGMFVEQNKIVVQDSYYGNRTWTLDKIAVTQGCVGPLCVGDSVFTNDMRSGQVAGYFGDGRIVIYDSYYGNRIFGMHNVGMSFGCTYSHCTGDRVITSDNRNGTVSGFMADGRIVVRDSYYGNRAWQPFNIAMTEAVCSNIYVQRVDICQRHR